MINIKGTLYDYSNPRIMGILNFTPDSFNPLSRVDAGEVKERIEKMLDDGADIIDIGGMSSRPGCEIVDENTEWNRLLPALEIISKHFSDIVFSLDTFRSQIVRKAVLDYGISIINDISAGDADDKMLDVVAECRVPYIVMHGVSSSDQIHSGNEYSNITADVLKFFSQKIAALHSRGVSDIILDPGFGFSKTLDENYELFSHLSDFDVFGLPILVGISRKSMIWKLLDTTVEKALNGTTVLNTIALQKGANILRVHDVAEAREALTIFSKCNPK